MTLDDTRGETGARPVAGGEIAVAVTDAVGPRGR